MTSKEQKAEYDRLRRINNKEKLLKTAQKYREDNKEVIAQKQRLRYNLNREKESERKREYYLKNKNLILTRCKQYREDNPKEKTGKNGTGNYNVTLAERHKEEWLKEELYLYKLQITDTDGTIFFKCGLAKNMRNRIYHIPYQVDIMEAVLMTKYDAVYAEREVLNNKLKYSPLIKFGGHTECFIEVTNNK